mgnify:CR=1 FL=1
MKNRIFLGYFMTIALMIWAKPHLAYSIMKKRLTLFVIIQTVMILKLMRKKKIYQLPMTAIFHLKNELFDSFQNIS